MVGRLAVEQAALARIGATLAQIRQHLDGTIPAESDMTIVAAAPPPDDLPQIEASMYLYEDVVLGVALSLLPSFGASEPGE